MYSIADGIVDSTRVTVGSLLGIKSQADSQSTGKVLLVRRFDRSADGARVHMEDFAQIFGRYPSEKYTGAAITTSR